MDIYAYNDFRSYLKDIIKSRPHDGHGQNKYFAEAAKISNAFFSQVLAEKRQLSLEQGSLLADYLGLNELQAEYFLTLIDLDRAGNPSLKNHLKKRIARLKKSAQVVAKRFTATNEVSKEDSPIYYSDWIYAAAQQLTALPDYSSEHEIAKRLNLPMKKTNDVIEFLLSTGLCIRKNGRLQVGPARIHLDPSSPWIKQHHANWRNQALENFQREDSFKLHYSSPMTLSKADCEKVRTLLLAAIESVAKVVDPSPSEELVCLNIDWFKVDRQS